MKINTSGLWSNNPAFVQLLGLCPLLATSNTLVNGLSMGLATTIVLLLSAVFISKFREVIPSSVRLPTFMLIIAGSVTFIELIMKAYFYELFIALGIFIPLIVTNCIIIARAEAFASKNSVKDSILDALIMGAGFSWVLLLLGGIREILAKGTLFSGLNTILGDSFIDTKIQIIEPHAFLLAALPAGAFMALGFLIAIKQAIDIKTKTNKNK